MTAAPDWLQPADPPPADTACTTETGAVDRGRDFSNPANPQRIADQQAIIDRQCRQLAIAAANNYETAHTGAASPSHQLPAPPQPIAEFRSHPDPGLSHIPGAAAPEYDYSAGSPSTGDEAHIYTGVKITAPNSSGRAFIVTWKGHNWAIAAAHVVAQTPAVNVAGQNYPVKARHDDLDIAFIYLVPSDQDGDGPRGHCLGRAIGKPLYAERSPASFVSSLDPCPLLKALSW